MGEFLGDGLAPRNASDIGAEDNFHSRMHRFREGDFMHRSPLSITLAVGSICRSPIVVVRAQCGAIPRTLLENLGDGGVVEVESVLDGVATAVECAMQSNSAISVAGDFFPPAMSFVDDGFQFLNRERGLRNQFAILSHP